MTKGMYEWVWQQTENAVKYLIRHGSHVVADSVPSGYEGARLLVYYASHLSEREERHVRSAYPLAKIELVSENLVQYKMEMRRKGAVLA